MVFYNGELLDLKLTRCKKIANPYFDRWAKKIRSKYDCEMITTKESYRKIAEQSKGKNYIYMVLL